MSFRSGERHFELTVPTVRPTARASRGGVFPIDRAYELWTNLYPEPMYRVRRRGSCPSGSACLIIAR
jgi:hypothetical protein